MSPAPRTNPRDTAPLAPRRGALAGRDLRKAAHRQGLGPETPGPGPDDLGLPLSPQRRGRDRPRPVRRRHRRRGGRRGGGRADPCQTLPTADARLDEPAGGPSTLPVGRPDSRARPSGRHPPGRSRDQDGRGEQAARLGLSAVFRPGMVGGLEHPPVPGSAPEGARGTRRRPVRRTIVPERVASRYAAAALRGESAKLRAAVDGTRNNTLFRAAFNLGQLVGAGLIGRG